MWVFEAFGSTERGMSLNMWGQCAGRGRENEGGGHGGQPSPSLPPNRQHIGDTPVRLLSEVEKVSVRRTHQPSGHALSSRNSFWYFHLFLRDFLRGDSGDPEHAEHRLLRPAAPFCRYP